MSKRLERRYSSNGYFHVHRFLLQVMSPGEAVMLCELMNRSAQFNASEQSEGWFVATVESLKASIGLGQSTQRRLLKALEAAGLVDTKKEGKPPKRQIKINFERVENLEDFVVNSNPVKMTDYTENNGYNQSNRLDQINYYTTYNSEYILKQSSFEKLDSENESESDMFFEELEVNPSIEKFDLVCAKKLKRIVQEKTTISDSSKNATWAKQFQLLRTKDGASKDRIKKALLWYIDHFGESFVPQAFSAAAFRKKFLQIESAMRRAEPVVVELHEDLGNLFETLCHDSFWDTLDPATVFPFLNETFKNFSDVRSSLFAFSELYNDSSVTIGLQSFMPSADAATMQWSVRTQQQLADWDSWNKQLSPFIWSFDSRHQAKGMSILCSGSSQWNLIKDSFCAYQEENAK